MSLYPAPLPVSFLLCPLFPVSPPFFAFASVCYHATAAGCSLLLLAVPACCCMGSLLSIGLSLSGHRTPWSLWGISLGRARACHVRVCLLCHCVLPSPSLCLPASLSLSFLFSFFQSFFPFFCLFFSPSFSLLISSISLLPCLSSFPLYCVYPSICRFLFSVSVPPFLLSPLHPSSNIPFIESIRYDL